MNSTKIKKALSKEDREIKEVIGSFLKIGDVYNIGRQGIISSFNGTRVGTWKWDTNRMVVSALNGDTGSKFRKILQDIIAEGVMAPEVRETRDEDILKTQIFYKLTEVSKLSPGELDSVMREKGYFVIDSNLPILSEGDEGDEV